MSILEPHTEKLKYIFDNTKVGIAICNAQDNTLEMLNPAFAHIHGYEPHELIGVSPGEVFAAECMLRLSEHESTPSCATNDLSFETIHTKKDGSPVHVSVHITVIKDENGVIKQRIANIQDISERQALRESNRVYAELFDKTVEPIKHHVGKIDTEKMFDPQKMSSLLLSSMLKKLEASEREFRSLAGNTPDNIARWDCEGRYLYINPVHERTLGKTASEVIGTLIPDSHDAVKTAITQVAATGKTITISQNVPSRDGSMDYHEVSIVPERDVSGNIISVLGIGRDITEHKKMRATIQEINERYAQIFNNSIDVIYMVEVTPDGKFIYIDVNTAYTKVTGIPRESVIGLCVEEIENEGFRTLLLDKFTSCLNAAEKTDYIADYPFPSGITTFHSILSPMFDENGRIVRIVGVARDITQQKETEKALFTREHEFRNLSENSPNIIIRYDRDYRKIYVNQAFVYHTGIAIEQAIHSKSEREWDNHLCMVSMNAQEYRNRIEQVIESGEADYFTMAWYRLSDGEYVAHEFYLAVEQDMDGNSIGVLAIGHDITERQKNEDLLIHKESRLKEAQKIAKVGSWELEFSSEKLTWSDEIYSIFEIEQNDQPPSYSDFLNAIHPQDRDFVSTQYSESLKSKLPYDTLHRLLFSDGRIKYVHEKGITYYDGNGTPLRSIGTAQDVTEHKLVEKKMNFLAYHDALTELPNRILAQDRTNQAIAHAKRCNTKVALLFIDLDEFKTINDALGHSVGDETLKIIASRLIKCVRESDTISRQGGDEFLLILSDIHDLTDVITITEKVLQEFEKAFFIHDHSLCTSASIGIALYPDHGETFELLLKNADTAMYKAKESGKNGYCFYTQQMNHHLIGQFKIQNDLKNALQNNEFILHYQPQIDLAKNTIIGAEALIRWHHPQLGMIPPMSFIPIAESSGLIVSIGEWVLQEACTQAAIWHKMGIKITVAVNISAVQFKRGNLKEIVQNALTSSGLNPHFLELELTESILINDAENVLKTVHNLKSLGIQLSIDDFGTGYSSLAYLKRFAVDKLKIDQSFVRDIVQDKEDATIVKTIIQMAKSLNLKSIAEGVEDAQVLSVINGYGCDEVQGYHFAKPLEATAFENYYLSQSHIK